MSGPKSGHVAFNPRELARLQRLREDEERRELEALETVARQAKLDERAERRRTELREREERRAHREEARARARAEAASRERQHALAAFQKRVASVEAALAQRNALRDSHPGIDLPEPLALGDEPAGDADAVRATASLLEVQVRAYQRALDDAISQWKRDQAAGQAVEGARAFMAAFKAMPVRRAEDVIAALGDDSAWGQRARADAQLAALVNRARELVDTAMREGTLEVSDQTLEGLEAVIESASVAAAQTALRRMIDSLESDKQASRAERERLAAAEAERAARAANEEEAKRRELLTQELQSVLEDLGYVVDDIQDGAVAGAGGLVALRPHWPDHAVRMEVHLGGGIRVEPVRLKNPQSAAVGAVDRALEEVQDKQFDEAFCGKSGSIDQVLKTARARGLDMTVRQEFLPGQNQLECFSTDLLGERARDVHRQWHGKRPGVRLQEKSHDPGAR